MEPAADPQLRWKGQPALMRAPDVFITPTVIFLVLTLRSANSFPEQATSETDIPKLPLQLSSVST